MILVFILHDLELRIVDKPATNFHFEYPRSKDENAIIDKEVQTFLRKLSIEEVANDTNTDFYSKLFTNRKTDSTNRTILNHKVFNKICTTELFKMESINILINILKLGMFPVSTNIKDIFYFALIFPGHTKYLDFTKKGKIYQLLAMPNGYIMSCKFLIYCLNLHLLFYMKLDMNHPFM